MKTTIQAAILAAIALCATTTFAATKAKVNIPFDFTSHGHTFPAGQYVATLDMNHNVLALSNVNSTTVSARWTVGPADFDPNNEKLVLKFDDLGSIHTLRTVQLGPRITSRLDAPSRHGSATSTVATVSGQ